MSVIAKVEKIPLDAVPLSSASTAALQSLKRNLPSTRFIFFGDKLKAINDLRAAIEKSNIEEIKEAIADLMPYLEIS